MEPNQAFTPTVAVFGVPNANAQLVTPDEAKQIAAAIGDLGGGVTQIYIPPYVGPELQPGEGDAQMFEFTFATGATGYNAGLIWRMMINAPFTWPAQIAIALNYRLSPDQAIKIPPPIAGPSTQPQAQPVAAAPLPPGFVMTLFGPERIPTPPAS